MIDQIEMGNLNDDVDFAMFWEEHCKDRIEESYSKKEKKEVSIYAQLSRDEKGEIVGHKLTGGSSCQIDSMCFWMRCSK